MKLDKLAELTPDLFQIMKQFPRLNLTGSTDDGLNQREYDLLVYLALNSDADTSALTVTELSNLLMITPAGVTHLLNPLEDEGCIQRLRSPDDRRVVLISLTEKGQNIAGNLVTRAQSKLAGLIEYLGEEDSKTLIRLMLKMIEFFSS